MADTAKPVRAGGPQRLQYRLDPVRQFQIGVTDDRRGGPASPIRSTRTGGGQPLDKFDLAHRAQLYWSRWAVHRTRFDEDGRADVVAAIDIGHQFVKQVALIGDARGTKVPEVMMGIADRDLRLQDGLLG
jgi:hypothetical protein